MPKFLLKETVVQWYLVDGEERGRWPRRRA
jgi:hypothetical protein